MSDNDFPRQNNAQGRRISEFPAQGAIDNNSFFTYILNGVNYKISAPDLIGALGATGALEQAGSSSAVPILDTQGSVFNIRGIETGLGVSASQSPENGISLSLNVSQSNAGVPVSDVDNQEIILRALEAGDGIQLSQDSTNQSIRIEATGALAATKTVLVNEEADFPTAVAGVITLEAGTVYVLANDVTTSARFVVPDSTSVTGSSIQSPTLTSTTTGDMFTAVSSSCVFKDINISCPNGRVWNVSASVAQPALVNIDDVRVASCQSVLLGENLLGLSISGLRVVDAQQGILVTGADNQVFTMVASFMNSTDPSFIGLDFNGGVFRVLNVVNNVFNGPVGSVGLDGSNPADDNIAMGDLGVIATNSFRGGMDALSATFEPERGTRWVVNTNDQISDTKADALIDLVGNTTQTVIGASGVPVLVAGTWVLEEANQFSADANGRITYLAERPRRLGIDVTASILKTGGGTQDFTMTVYKNGSPIAGTRKLFEIEAGATVSVTTLWTDTVELNDFYEIFVTNEDNTNNPTVESAVFRIV